MTCKLFELRDQGTFIPVLCVKVEAGNDAEHYLLRRAGYKLPSDLVIMAGLSCRMEWATCDCFDWLSDRTRHAGHLYITKHWNELQTGDVVDVEYILGESQQPKTSERMDVS